MKKTALVLCALLLVLQTGTTKAQDWSAAQREALAVLQASVDADLKNNIDDLTPLYHENFVGWNFSDPKPVEKSEFLASEASFLKNVKFIYFKITPLSIKITNNNAVVNVVYNYSYVAKDNKTITTSGRWNAMLAKNDSKWLFLSCCYLDIK